MKQTCDPSSYPQASSLDLTAQSSTKSRAPPYQEVAHLSFERWCFCDRNDFACAEAGRAGRHASLFSRVDAPGLVRDGINVSDVRCYFSDRRELFGSCTGSPFIFIRQADAFLVWVNLLFLMLIALLAFSAGLISHLLVYPISRPFYFGNQLAIACLLNVDWLYAKDKVLTSGQVIYSSGANEKRV